MRITSHSRNQLRLQSVSFIVLFLAVIFLLAYLGHQHNISGDWTAGSRNSLSKASIDLMAALDKPIGFTVYATENEVVRKPISDLINRYKTHYADIDIRFINPELEPAMVREEGISINGEVVIKYGDRSEHLTERTEQAFTNALQRMARSEERFLVFIGGHGERDPHGIANHDLSDWVKQLASKGIKAVSQNLIDRPKIPDNTAVLVIAGPEVDLLSGEVKLINDYVETGGNLLWLTDPGSIHQLDPLAEYLGIEFLDGTIVDPTTKLFGIDDPRMTLISEYPFHDITRNLNKLTLFPQTRGIVINENERWLGKAFLQSLPRSWSEAGELAGTVKFNADTDTKGPLTIGVVLTTKPAFDEADNEPAIKQQRIVVIGDGDFLSNSYLGNGGNLDLGINIVNWLSHDDRFVAIAAKTAPDIHLELTPIQQGIIAFGFLIILPLGMAASGTAIWLRRRKR